MVIAETLSWSEREFHCNVLQRWKDDLSSHRNILFSPSYHEPFEKALKLKERCRITSFIGFGKKAFESRSICKRVMIQENLAR